MKVQDERDVGGGGAAGVWVAPAVTAALAVAAECLRMWRGRANGQKVATRYKKSKWEEPLVVLRLGVGGRVGTVEYSVGWTLPQTIVVGLVQ